MLTISDMKFGNACNNAIFTIASNNTTTKNNPIVIFHPFLSILYNSFIPYNWVKDIANPITPTIPSRNPSGTRMSDSNPKEANIPIPAPIEPKAQITVTPVGLSIVSFFADFRLNDFLFSRLAIKTPN